MFKNANIFYEIKNSKRRRYYAKFQDLALKRRREIFYEMDPRSKHLGLLVVIVNKVCDFSGIGFTDKIVFKTFRS